MWFSLGLADCGELGRTETPTSRPSCYRTLKLRPKKLAKKITTEKYIHCGSLNVIGPQNSTIGICGFVGVGIALLEKVCHCWGRLWDLINAQTMPIISALFLLPVGQVIGISAHSKALCLPLRHHTPRCCAYHHDDNWLNLWSCKPPPQLIFFPFIRVAAGCWRHDSLVQSIALSSKGPEFNSQQPYGGSQPSVMRSGALFWPVDIHAERILYI